MGQTRNRCHFHLFDCSGGFHRERHEQFDAADRRQCRSAPNRSLAEVLVVAPYNAQVSDCSLDFPKARRSAPSISFKDRKLREVGGGTMPLTVQVFLLVQSQPQVAHHLTTIETGRWR
jgi:hypothetical protein